MSILIIGSGIAAVSALKAIRSNEPDTRITLVTGERVPFYYRPMIPLVMSGEKNVEDAQLTFDPVKTFGAELVFGTVSSLDTASKNVSLSDGRKLSYERLLIASGSSPIMPETLGTEGEGVFVLRTIDDALKIKGCAEQANKAAVIGGGFVGIKAAESLRKMGLHVTVIEQLPLILSPCTDMTASGIIAARLKGEGIEIITGQKVRKILRDNKRRVKGVQFGSGEIEADMVIVAAGVKPNVDFLTRSGVKFDRGVLVNDYLQTSENGVYAAGDVVQYRELIRGDVAVSVLWSNAVLMGRIAGTNLSGGKIKHEGFLSVMNASDIGGIGFVSVGIVQDESGNFEVYQHRDGENYRKILFDGEKVAGALLLGDITRAGIFTNIIRNRFPLPGLLKDKAIRGRLSYSQFLKAL